MIFAQQHTQTTTQNKTINPKNKNKKLLQASKKPVSFTRGEKGTDTKLMRHTTATQCTCAQHITETQTETKINQLQN